MTPRTSGVAVLAGFLAICAPTAALAETAEVGLLTRFGEYFLVGGGLTNYLDHTVKDRADTGYSWEARAGFGSRFFVGGELAYVGSTRTVTGFGRSLVAQGLESDLRVQYPYETGKWLIEPFALVGVGWSHFSINTASKAARNDADDVLVMPVGGGVMVGYERLLLDLRFSYRQTFSENLVSRDDGSAASLKSWAVTASLGVEF